MADAFSIKSFFDEATRTVTYLVWENASRSAAVIDPVLDFDAASGRIGTTAADIVLNAAEDNGLHLLYVLETHAHADHLSAAAYMKARTGARIGIGEHIGSVQRTFRPRFRADDIAGDGDGFDLLLADGDPLPLGALAIEVLHTPGHTQADVSYRLGDALFVGDTLFMPDYGTARTDFPGGDARTLYRSIRRILELPPQTRLFMCHDYKAPGRDYYAWETRVAEERAHNVHIHDGISEDAFVAARHARDETLAAPALLLPSIQVNIRGGRLPPAPAGQTPCLLLPVSIPDPALARALAPAARK